MKYLFPPPRGLAQCWPVLVAVSQQGNTTLLCLKFHSRPVPLVSFSGRHSHFWKVLHLYYKDLFLIFQNLPAILQRALNYKFLFKFCPQQADLYLSSVFYYCRMSPIRQGLWGNLQTFWFFQRSLVIWLISEHFFIFNYLCVLTHRGPPRL